MKDYETVLVRWLDAHWYIVLVLVALLVVGAICFMVGDIIDTAREVKQAVTNECAMLAGLEGLRWRTVDNDEWVGCQFLVNDQWIDRSLYTEWKGMNK